MQGKVYGECYTISPYSRFNLHSIPTGEGAMGKKSVLKRHSGLIQPLTDDVHAAENADWLADGLDTGYVCVCKAE